MGFRPFRAVRCHAPRTSVKRACMQSTLPRYAAWCSSREPSSKSWFGFAEGLAMAATQRAQRVSEMQPTPRRWWLQGRTARGEQLQHAVVVAAVDALVEIHGRGTARRCGRRHEGGRASSAATDTLPTLLAGRTDVCNRRRSRC